MTEQEQKVTDKSAATTRRVSVSKLWTDPDTFQPRTWGIEEHHVRELVSVLKTGIKLDPMIVWEDPANGRLYVIDGHHRLRAYQATDRAQRVRVKVFTGDRAQARKKALDANRKIVRSLTQEDRTDAAWGLVRIWDPAKGSEGHTFSAEEIAKSAGVAKRTVQNMRRVMREASEKDGTNPGELPSQWWRALSDKDDADREQPSEDEMEEQTKARANAYDAQIGEAIAKMAREDPDALGRVIGRRAGSHANTIFGFCETSLGEDDLERMEDEELDGLF